MNNPLQYIRSSLHEIYPLREVDSIARLILEEVFGINLLDIYIGKDIQLSEIQQQNLKNIITRLRNYEPIQYILGFSDFCNLRFKVTPDVLIPRPETAELIELIRKNHPIPPQKILDIGSGSGCIAITLSHHWPDATIIAWDISEKALCVARDNNSRLNTHVTFEQHDILEMEEENLSEHFDLIVSNPPYIKECERETMEENVLRWEPDLALFVPNEDPLLFYRNIIRKATTVLNPQGHLYFEINREHGHDIITLLERHGFTHIKLHKDFFGNDRIIEAQLNKTTKST